MELLVVIALIGLLAGLLLPTLANAKQQGKRAGCLSNLRQIGLACLLYAEDHGTYPSAYETLPASSSSGLSTNRWMDLVKPSITKSSCVFLCPADPQRIACKWDPEICLSYGINSFQFGDNAHCFWYAVRPESVRRPTGTILLADCTPGLYYCGGGRFKNPVTSVDYRHPRGGFVAAFCDGHAETRFQTQQRDWDASQ